MPTFKHTSTFDFAPAFLEMSFVCRGIGYLDSLKYTPLINSSRWLKSNGPPPQELNRRKLHPVSAGLDGDNIGNDCDELPDSAPSFPRNTVFRYRGIRIRTRFMASISGSSALRFRILVIPAQFADKPIPSLVSMCLRIGVLLMLRGGTLDGCVR